MVSTTRTNKPINPRGNDQSPKGYNRAELYTGKALDFDGTNDTINCGTLDVTDYTAWSVAFNFKVDALSGTQIIYSLIHSSSDDIRILVTSGGAFQITFDDGTTDEIGILNPIELGKIYNASISYDGTNVVCYLNAIEVSTGTASFDFSTADGDLYLGSRLGSGFFFDGKIYGFKQFNTALTAAQVADLYNNPEKIVPTGVADSALKLWLPMQEGAGTTAFNGAPDALGSEQITGFTNGSTYAFDTFTTSGNDISSAIKTSGFAGAASNAISLTNGDKVFVSFDYTHTSGDPLRVLISQNASGAGATMSDVAYISTTGKFTHIFTVTSTQDGYLQLGTGGSTQSINASMENISFKIVSGIGTISGATWTHGIGAPVSQTSVIDWNKWTLDGTNEVLVPEGLTAGRDLLGNLFENVRKQGALNLDGNSWAEVHDNASLDFGTGSFSIEAWAKVKYVNDGSSYNAILTLGGNAADNTSLSITSSLEPRFEYAGDSSSVSSSNEGDWVHLVGTYDETNATFYINGSQEDQDARTATDITNALAKRIGRDSTSTRFYNDQIAQPRIYNRALTAEEVERNYNAGKNIYK